MAQPSSLEVSDRVSGNGQPDSLPPRGAGRRRSLIVLALLLLGLPLAFVIRAATDAGWRQITSVEVLKANDVIYLPDVEIFLVAEEPPLALSAESPHVGELLAYCESGRNFVSLAHGEMFDRTGRYIDGPAPRGMDRVAVRVRDGSIEINLAGKIPGPPRGSGLVPEEVPCNADQATPTRQGFVERVLPG